MSVSKRLLHQLSISTSVEERQLAVDAACAEPGGCELIGVSLSGCDLSGLRLSRVKMGRVNLQGSNCTNVTFPAMIDCTFDDACAERTSFSRLENCRFRGAVLTSAVFVGKLTNCDFSGSRLRHARIGAIPAEEQFGNAGNNFTQADLSTIDATGACLWSSNFRSAYLKCARLSRAILSRCDFRCARCIGANLLRARLEDISADEAIFDESLMLPEQARTIRLSCPLGARAIQVVLFSESPSLSVLAQELMSIREFKLTWQMCRRDGKASEKLMVTNRLSSGELRGYAFDADSGELIRMYPLEGPARFIQIMLDIAADYAGWRVVGEEVEVESVAQARRNSLLGRFREAVKEVFCVVA